MLSYSTKNESTIKFKKATIIQTNIDDKINEINISILEIGEIRKSLNDPICFILIMTSDRWLKLVCIIIDIIIPGIRKFMYEFSRELKL